MSENYTFFLDIFLDNGNKFRSLPWKSRRALLPAEIDMGDLPRGALGSCQGDALDGRRGRRLAVCKRQERDERQRKV